ncbi:phage tail tape measure protein, partial [Candidatus Fermentibacteria bacterium]
ELFEKTKQPFGEDEFTRGVYKDLLDKLESGTLGAPSTAIKEVIDQIADLDKGFEAILSDGEMFERKGAEAVDAWDFEKVAKRARVLREALSQYSKFNLSDEFQTDVEKKFQVRGLLQYLKQIEQVYGKLDLQKLQKGPFGEYETGAIKVPGFLPPQQQTALHRRNIQKFKEFSARPGPESETPGTGPRVGESFSYFEKVTDSAGNVLRNFRHDFKKFGETTDETAGKIKNFSHETTDLIDKMQMSGGTFRSATRRVIMWGAAATLVYGGVQQLKDSIGELADIEVGIAQLRMVMNPLESDFNSLTNSAVGFAKEYGVSVTEVLRGMKIFAQQGLKQAEVIERARVSTLAANVTTLSAGEATEALAAAMKVFGNEIGSADMALDSWSETEARHAITAADMANAIKKSAAAAKNAGFTFNELNGIVAGIGAVTRQSGKEVGTAMRFIARRIFSEKGPKSLAEIQIPTVTGTGENRRGFDILSDLSMKWDELTNAQKLNIAQSLGGTRQYNALLVAMDNWDEVLEAIEDSTNSKGSAERRNVEIMKTYQKQLEQTKAAATELKLELGKFIFPVFKTGLKALRVMFEVMADIPMPVKAAGVALTLFFGYASKGLAIFDKLSELIGRGKGAISSFIGSVTKEFDMSNFEIFGKGFGDPIKGLKTFAKGAPDLLKATGLGDLHSGFGKLVFLIKGAGDSYNEFLAVTGKGAEGVGKGIEAFGKKIKDTARIVDYSTDIFQLMGLSTGPFISAGTQIVESLAKGTGLAIEKSGKLFGKSGQKVAEFLSDADPGLFKSIAPLAITLGTMGLALRGVASSLDRSRKSAQEYAQSVYNARRVEEDQIKELTHATRQYDRLQKRLEKINKLMASPELRAQQQDSSNYTSPLLGLSEVQADATKLANELAEINSKLVIGYDEQGDAILRLTGSYKTYIESLQRASSLELAKTDIDVLKKFTESLTDTGFGESIKRVLKTALGEVPGLGGVLENLISVSPGKEMQVLTGELNELLSLREKYPLSDVFDQDINKLQEALGKVKTIYDETATDFKRTLAGIFKFEGAQNIDRDTIARLLADPELTKGFELLLEIEPKITTVNRARLADNVGKVTTEDVIGSEILKRIFPKKKAFIDYTSELTAAQVESAGILAREGKQVASGDIVTFFPELAKKYNIAGAQAVVELKKGADGVYEAFATYINSKTLEVEQRELDDPGMLDIVDRIFPSGRIQSELENRLDALNTFVAGAAAGLVGIEPQKFKKDFDLGSRFYSELPTTTVLQADKGFNIQSGQFGALPQLQQEWARMTQDFFIKPMAKYNREVNSLTKNTLDGLDESAQLSKTKADELYDQQAILRNNQVVVQFAAVFADLSKTMEESSRALSENLAVEKARQESVKTTTGLLKGV